MDSDRTSGSWKLPWGSKCPRSQIVFATQVAVAFLVIITAIVNLSVPTLNQSTEARNYWKIVLSSTIGYLFPSPTISASPKPPNTQGHPI